MIADEVEKDIVFVRKAIEVMVVFALTYTENTVLGTWLKANGSN